MSDRRTMSAMLGILQGIEASEKGKKELAASQFARQMKEKKLELAEKQFQLDYEKAMIDYSIKPEELRIAKEMHEAILKEKTAKIEQEKIAQEHANQKLASEIYQQNRLLLDMVSGGKNPFKTRGVFDKFNQARSAIDPTFDASQAVTPQSQPQKFGGLPLLGAMGMGAQKTQPDTVSSPMMQTPEVQEDTMSKLRQRLNVR